MTTEQAQANLHALRNLMTLPAWTAAPPTLRTQVESLVNATPAKRSSVLGSRVRRWSEQRDWEQWDLEHPYVPVGEKSGSIASDPLRNILDSGKADKEWSPGGIDPFDVAAVKQEESLTSGQTEALNLYTGTAYNSINGQLRGNQAVDEGTASLTTDLDSAIEGGNTLSSDTTMYRGVNGDASGFTAGTVLQDNAFLSTSASDKVATQFSINPGNTDATHSYIMEITAPSGTKYLVGNTDERELLLGRSTPLVVDSVDMENKQGFLNIPRVYAHIGES
jgi:hypothetical protein